MDRRLELHSKLMELVPNVYFQPPPGRQMVYPCIVYNREYIDSAFAGNKPYRLTKRYMVTVIDRDPDSELPVKIASLGRTQHVRFYTADGLNHDVFRLHY